MNLCNDGHTEVCYEERECPVCELIKEYENRLDNMTEKLTSMEADIQDLNERLAS